MKNGCDKEEEEEVEVEKNVENSGPLSLLPVDRMNGNRLQCQPLIPRFEIGHYGEFLLLYAK